MDLDDDTDLTCGAYLLAYGCGCAVKIISGWVTDATPCDADEHQFIGVQGE